MKAPESAEKRLAELRDQIEATYRVAVGCSNCEWRGHLDIKRGHAFTNARACPNCGCRWTLVRRFL